MSIARQSQTLREKGTERTGSSKKDSRAAKLNCWDFHRCYSNNSNHSICPVKKEFIANGLNGGINGGRICWVIEGNHCKEKTQTDCFQCEFHYKVMAEEGLLKNCTSIGIYLGNLKKT